MRALEPSSNRRKQDILRQALTRKTPVERAAFLDGACGSNVALRVEIEALLAAEVEHQGTAPFIADALGVCLGGATQELTPTLLDETPLTEGPGTVIGRYKLLEQIGEGGFGVVYQAEQREPVKRRAALKIIKLGMDTRQVVARFEAERQSLALMDHPNIAKVFDAGATETGRPYFVMELVRGIRITDYCDQNNLPTGERLDLFLKVCQAIQHAHQKGIIHRDIKPSNILVTLDDGVPVPKVIDFGIAKATAGQTLTDKTLFTAFEQFIGTPAYMSPEQAEMSGMDIDTRSDIYSLGVLLYELLAGSTPFDAKELMASGVDAMRKTIRDREPVRPSTRLATLEAGELTTTAKHRSADTSKLLHQLEGDLDWIVMKCLEKDRTRRYETANGLAADLKRHMTNEPVLACPPSSAYRFQKLVRRNKLTFAAAAAVAAALLFGIIVSTWQAARATHAKLDALSARQQAEASEQKATEQRKLAQDRLMESLIREAQSLRLARQVGYRQQVNDRIRQVLALPASHKRMEALRSEAAQCLGDPVGQEPLDLAPVTGGSGCAALDAEGTVLAAAAPGLGVMIQQAVKDSKPVAIQLEGQVRSLAFSLNGRSLFGLVESKPAAADEMRLMLWRRSTVDSWPLVAERTLPGAFRLFDSLAGVVVAARREGGRELHLIEVESDRVIGRIAVIAGNERPLVIGLSPDRHFAALRTTKEAGGIWDEILIWDLQGNAPRAKLQPLLGPAVSASFGANGAYVACTCENGIQVFDTTRFEPVATFRGYFFSLTDTSASLGVDGSMLAFPIEQEDGVRLFKISSGADVARVATRGTPFGTQFSLSGTTLAVFGEHPTRLLRLGDTEEKLSLRGHVGGVPAVEFSPDGSLVVSTGKDRKLRFWDAHSGKLLEVSEDLPGFGQSIGISSDGRWLASGDYNTDHVQIWSLESRKRLFTLGKGRPGGTMSCGFSSNGRYLVAAGIRLRIWELAPQSSGTQVTVGDFRLVSTEQINSRNMFFDPTGQGITYEGTAQRQGKDLSGIFRKRLDLDAESTYLATSSEMIQSLDVVPRSGELVRVDPRDRILTFLDPHLGQVIRTLPTLQPGERSAAYLANFKFSPTGIKVAISSSSGRAVSVFDVADGRRLCTLPEDSGSVWWLAWDSGGGRLAISRSDGDISIWDLAKVDRQLEELGLGLAPAPRPPVTPPAKP